MSRHKIIVGVDFGTTYTGVSFVDSRECDVKDITVITQWPGGGEDGNETLKKVPSLIAYRSENSAFGYANNTWGYSFEPGMRGYSWFKLLLDANTVVSEYDDPGLQAAVGNVHLMKLPPNKTARDVVEDLLRLVYPHVISELEKRYTASALRITPMEFWFTVPAIWSDEAQDATLKAALKAGFGSRSGDEIKKIAEPEAAAIASLKTTRNLHQGLLQVNTGIMICDCGGGTVDLTSYTITALEPSIKLEEACVGIGGKCGATFIDRNFHKLMSIRYGSAFTNLPSEKTGIGSQFLRDFERIKRDFSGDDMSRRHQIRLIIRDLMRPGANVAGYDQDEGQITVSSYDIKACFDPVVNKVLALVEEQIGRVKREKSTAIKTIMLVGGFGRSPYLWRRLQTWCEIHGDIRLLYPPDPWSAISRGAALRGLEGALVHKRRCKKHYGIEICQQFNANLDAAVPSSETSIDQFDGSKWTHHCIDWQVKKNEILVLNETRCMDIVLDTPDRRPYTSSLKLFSCTLDDPPRRTEHARAELNGEIHFDYDGIDWSVLRWTLVGLVRLYRIPFQIVMNLGDNHHLLEFTIKCQGRIVGTGKISFVYS